MSDLISREDAVALVIKAIHGTDNKEIQEYLFDGLRKQMWSLPSAESTGAMDEAIQEYIKDGYMQPIGEDLISRQDAVNEIHKYFVEEIDKTPTEIDEDGDELYADMPTVNSLLACNKELSKIIKSLPSAEVEDRLYIKIYADDEPSVMAEKLYQICGETQNREVAEWLKEYFPSAPDSRQRGEWVWDEDAVDWGIGAWVCNKCGSRPQTWWSTDRNKNPLICAGSRFCGNCGADMRGDSE